MRVYEKTENTYKISQWLGVQPFRREFPSRCLMPRSQQPPDVGPLQQGEAPHGVFDWLLQKGQKNGGARVTRERPCVILQDLADSHVWGQTGSSIPYLLPDPHHNKTFISTPPSPPPPPPLMNLAYFQLLSISQTQGWAVSSIFDEYSHFASPKARLVDQRVSEAHCPQ